MCDYNGASYVQAVKTRSMTTKPGTRKLTETSQVDYIPLLHSVHRLSGIASPMNAACSAEELEQQLKMSGAKCLFTCMPLLATALQAAKAVAIPEDKIFIIDLPGYTKEGPFATVEELITEGRSQPELEPLVFTKGQGARQVAFLCYSSGTSGLPVGQTHIRIRLGRYGDVPG